MGRGDCSQQTQTYPCLPALNNVAPAVPGSRRTDCGVCSTHVSNVQPTDSPSPGNSRGRSVLALSAVLLVVAAGFALGRGGPARVGGADPAPDLTERVARPIDVVQAFGAALADGQGAAAASLIADEWDQLELPGLPFRSLDGITDRAELANALDFYSELVDLETVRCRVESQTLSAASAQVVCDSSVDSIFAEVGDVAGRAIPTKYWIEDDQISGILRNHLGTPRLEPYCHWVESDGGGSTLFDAGCSLVLSQQSSQRYQEQAAAYLAAGRPSVGRAYRVARGGITVVDILVRQLNRSGQPEVLVDRAAAGSAAPGVLGGSPSLEEFLEWSKIVYRIETGPCFVDGSAAPRQFGLSCPEARWSGPLIAGLTLDAVNQPVEFTVERVAVRAIAGETNPALLASWDRFCEWVTAARPVAAAAALADGCDPIYGETAARNLLTLVAEYAADPR